jgi:hypothetical protein
MRSISSGLRPSSPRKIPIYGETLYTFLDLDEGSVVGQFCDLAVHDVADMVAFLEGNPRILRKMLE